MPRTELRRSSDLKEQILDEIVSSDLKTKILPNKRQRSLFLKHYYGDVPAEDLAERSAATLAKIAASHLEFAAKRRRGQALVRVINPREGTDGYNADRTYVEMVNDDMPFLVDSVFAAINRHDLTVLMTVHPVLRVNRDRNGQLTAIYDRDSNDGRLESFVRFAIDKETDAARIKALIAEIRAVLADVRISVRDWQKMRDILRETRDALQRGPAGANKKLLAESRELLTWMADDRFTFLGYREYKLRYRGKRVYISPVEGTSLGLLAKKKTGPDTIELTSDMRRLARAKDWLIITKANSRSTVHRNAYLDYVGVKMYDKNGKAIGERRFIGLFTSAAYNESPRSIPLLRHKIDRVVARTCVEPSGHRGKALLHILDTFPRDELFQSSVSDLSRTVTGILNLQDRQRVRFFLRRDMFRRFFSCLIYVPRDKYVSGIRITMEKLLLDSFEGVSAESSVELTDSPLARIHIIVHVDPGERPRISINQIEEQIDELIISWTDRLRNCLRRSFGAAEGNELFRSYGDIFPAGYQEDTSPRDACSDLNHIVAMRRDGVVRKVELFRPMGSEPSHMHFMVFSDSEPMVLSETLPILEDMGVDVYTEHPYELRMPGDDKFWIQDFHLRHTAGREIDVQAVSTRFEDCFMQVLAGNAENDGLNRLILTVGLDWRQVSLLRCYTKYLLQLAMPFSQDYMEDVLIDHARLVGLLVQQFEAQFDPALTLKQRGDRLKKLLPAIQREVEKAKNVDEDRILTAFAGTISATLRTNFYQQRSDATGKPYLSIKLNTREIPEAPLPRPKFEIFVYSTQVEGVHLRGGDVARGGLRWSDRREDFRTEVLGLMKAQVVKNTVIVPSGAKGGFFCKHLPEGDRQKIFDTGVACYKTFISGLLDITDSVVDGKVVTPKDVVRRDGEDPYLVVAADKGTATFSDIANGISQTYGFWLDDAFASGGSAGYDHKKMGITARGAWVAVQRHFRERGLNVQKDEFTVAGVGDMGGDVFGNGMLLSRKIKLVAAFNHLHIFLDPTPNPAASFRERNRLFKRAGASGWDEYNGELISKGGGVFSRNAKTISLSREVRSLLGVEDKSLKPDELVHAILKMDVDLLWNGGIGTYAKASNESHAEVGDRSNDHVRVNASQLRCKVIGEGGNLGLTQLARIEYSLDGGRINTDFIDNSAGVDSSDREVNIKILLSDVAEHRGMSRPKRDALLESMTDDVADLVLRNNYLQTQAISMSEVRSLERIDETARVITSLERTGLLDRELEFLPDDLEIEDRKARKQGITRPELAVILSYAKIDLYNGLMSADETLEDLLVVHPMRYFPEVLRRRYADLIPGHRLSPQILATLIANDIVNRMGPAFTQRVQLDTGASFVTIARAYTVARQITRAGQLNRTIESMDNEIPAAAQTAMMFDVARTQRHAVYWLIERFEDNMQIEPLVERLKEGMTTVYTRTSAVLSTAARERHNRAVAEYIELGVPDKLADRMATLKLTRAALDIADLAAEYQRDVMESARVYSAFNENLGIAWLHAGAEDMRVHGRWQSIARRNLREKFYLIRRDLAAGMLKSRSRKDVAVLVDDWLSQRHENVERFKQMLSEMRLRNAVDFASLSVAAQELQDLLND
ncbi:MAG: NAD-glutamate dehydrogenase [Pseudomonadota bacterium]